jgi:hypothetical protein
MLSGSYDWPPRQRPAADWKTGAYLNPKTVLPAPTAADGHYSLAASDNASLAGEAMPELIVLREPAATNLSP